jgi:hypothetical protein
MLTPRWTHAIDVRAQSRREDSMTLMAMGLSLLAVLRDHPVPMAPVPRADLPRRAPQRPPATLPVRKPTPMSVPQEIKESAEHSAATEITTAGR